MHPPIVRPTVEDYWAIMLAMGMISAVLVLSRNLELHINFKLVAMYDRATNKHFYVNIDTTAPSGWKLKILYFYKTSKVKWCTVLYDGELYVGLVNNTNRRDYYNNDSLYADELHPSLLQDGTQKCRDLPSLDSFHPEVRQDLWGVYRPWWIFLKSFVSVKITCGSGNHIRPTYVASDRTADWTGPEPLEYRHGRALELYPLVIPVWAQKGTFHNRAIMLTIDNN